MRVNKFSMLLPKLLDYLLCSSLLDVSNRTETLRHCSAYAHKVIVTEEEGFLGQVFRGSLGTHVRKTVGFAREAVALASLMACNPATVQSWQTRLTSAKSKLLSLNGVIATVL